VRTIRGWVQEILPKKAMLRPAKEQGWVGDAQVTRPANRPVLVQIPANWLPRHLYMPLSVGVVLQPLPLGPRRK